jgi:chemotaxis protein histidine kinase CheA
MAEFYIEEADDVLPELQANVNAWLGDMNDAELIATIKRQMHTLKGAALMAKAEAIGTITHAMESLFESIALNIIAPDQRCAELVRVVLNTINDMTSVMRQGIAYESPIALIQCLQHAVDSNEIDLAFIYDSPVIEAPTTSHPAANIGIETVEEVGEVELMDAQPSEPTNQEPIAIPDSTAGRKRARGGRGKGGAKRHAESAAKPDVGPADELKSGPVQLNHDSLEVVHDEPIQILSDVTAPAPMEKIPHAETFSADLNDENAPSNRNEAFAQEAEKEFDRIYSIEGIDKPLVHQQVQSRSIGVSRQ